MSEDNQDSPPSMSIIVYSSRELSGMSNLSTTSVLGALNLVGMDIQNSVDNIQICINKGLHQGNQLVGIDI